MKDKKLAMGGKKRVDHRWDKYSPTSMVIIVEKEWMRVCCRERVKVSEKLHLHN